MGLGCGGPATVVNPTGKGGVKRVIDRTRIASNLKQVGLAYQMCDNPPKGPDDLLPFLDNNATFAKWLKEGDVVVIWGVRTTHVQSPSQTILAYEKDPDENGVRYVLMADNSSVKPMTIQEFDAAPKAKGN